MSDSRRQPLGEATSLTLLNRLSREPCTADWHRLVAVYSPLISRWCDRMGVSVSDRDDLTQDTLIVMIRGVSQFEHRGHGSFRGWIRTILSNHLRNYFRRKGPILKADWDQLDDEASSISQAFNREHDLHVARVAMERVKECCTLKAWQAFDLLMLRQQPIQEVAVATGLSPNAVLKARARVMKRIRAEIATMTNF